MLNKTKTTAEAKKMINPQHYAEYRKLGGKLTWNRYHYVAAVFVRMTVDAFVGGEGGRSAAVESFQAWANQYGWRERAVVIFRSIDRVTPYT